MFNFEKLETWHEAIAFADLVYQLTRKFPDDERFGLTNQDATSRRVYFFQHRRG